MKASKKILVIHGPNLNLLGKREQKIYGKVTLSSINEALAREAKKEGVGIEFFQSNHEGEIVSRIQRADQDCDAIVINPAAFTHTSVAIRDAIAAISAPVIEVHLSNIHAREAFRKESYISPVARGVVFGFGKGSYLLGLKGAISLLKKGT
ncbi:MAG: type II 3-dehydroquinate dehydratase [Deltaproteobacteria bacterium]|nr:type II 3-dehydroquinate dehydratase [Deltaproteobacteria bacterium]MBI2500942.1 type II 3-dehydroquinate dehydratase [Deltaproteobacteria bacterium]MBI4196281.1 type II 3-dehydroquinate dehydratase [Deltaproteobacteria bacterium]